MVERPQPAAMEPDFEPVGELQVPARKPTGNPPPPPVPQPVPRKPAGSRVDVDLDALRIRPDQAPPQRRSRAGGLLKTLIVLVLLGLGGLYAWREVWPRLTQEKPATVQVAKARMTGAAEQRRAGAFSAAGWVKLPRHHPVFVTPLIEGRVEELLVIEGDKVEAGQILARLYAEDYRAAHEAAEAGVAAAEARHAKMKAGYRKQEIAEAGAAIDRLKAELATAKRVLAHSEELQPGGAISEEELLRDATRVKTLAADLEKARHGLALLQEGFRAEDVALAAAEVSKANAERDLAKQHLDYAEIRSPIGGVVLERLASKGEWLQPKDGALVSLYDPTDLEARVDISQDDLGRVFLKQDVEVTTRAEPKRIYAGTVLLVEPKADLIKNTVPVRVKLAAKHGDLLFPDMVVSARFLPVESDEEDAASEEVAPVLTVPRGATFEVGGKAFVVVLEDGRAHRRAVTLGDSRGARVVIDDGLREGDTVVVSAPETLSEGTAVVPSP